MGGVKEKEAFPPLLGPLLPFRLFVFCKYTSSHCFSAPSPRFVARRGSVSGIPIPQLALLHSCFFF